MHKNFLGVKGMTLMGEVVLEFKRLLSNPQRKQYPSSAEGSNPLGTRPGSRC